MLLISFQFMNSGKVQKEIYRFHLHLEINLVKTQCKSRKGLIHPF